MTQFVGESVLRKEDAALLSGRGRYADDLPVPAGTLQAHVIRSPRAHADIVAIDARAALERPGVHAVITGEDVKKLSDPFLIALKAPVNQWSLAVALSMLAWYVFAPQCVSTFAVIRRETNSWRVVGVAAAYLFGLAYLASLITYQLARAWS